MVHQSERYDSVFCPKFEAVAIAASWGGIEAFKRILSSLPANFPLPILFLLHVGDQFPPVFPASLACISSLPVKWAEHGEQLRKGYAYFAPPGAHLVVGEDKRLLLMNAPRINHARPSANLLFSSMAFAFKQRGLNVILTGYGSDGAVGLSLVKAMGGKVIAQDEESSTVFDMPGAAINAGIADLVLPLDKIAPALVALAMVPGTAELFWSADDAFSGAEAQLTDRPIHPVQAISK